ncbi:MAG: 2-vinyl bacteriochlorophyllide hydratase [Deltaproteobacteria bacterium]|nr:2-vinyl bacteriochlorophyllide hydratase [Deltaproteobacteria bacterium]
MYTPEQLARRKASIWTPIVTVLSILQFLAFIISFYLVIRFLSTGQGYTLATISVWVKITMLWCITLAGMLWEKDVYGHYFMCKEFFWEDMGNLIAMLTHNAYFIVQWMSFDPKKVMLVMLFAYITYLFNFGQFMLKWYKSFKQRQQSHKESG